MNTAMMNDIFRKTMGNSKEIPGRVVLTSQVASDIHIPDILEAVSTFDSFSEANDPHHEHDFGSVKVDGQTYFFKFDYYHTTDGGEPDFQFGAEDPMNCFRIMTIMAAEEY